MLELKTPPSPPGREGEFEVLNPDLWTEPLEQFSRVTGLVVSLYSTTGEPIAGPFTPTPLTEYYRERGAWNESGLARRFEIDLVNEVVRRQGMHSLPYASMLSVVALPLKIDKRVAGVFTVGWMFDHFADPIESDRLAKMLGAAPAHLWNLIRQHSPVSASKLSGYCGLLHTIATSLITEFVNRRNEFRNSRVLRILNQSAQSLTSAETEADISRATVEAARLLTESRKATLTYVGHQTQQPSELIEENRIALKIPVQAADGTYLAELEVMLETDSRRESVEIFRAELSALCAQVAVAIQKVRLINDLRRERATLQSAIDELRRASLARDEFIATVSHELRSPLNAILGWCEILRDGGSNEQLNAGLETIQRNAETQAKLIEDLLDISRIMTGKLFLQIEAIDTVTVVSEAIKAIKPTAELKGVDVQVEVQEPNLWIKGDRVKLQQVFWNILANAVKYTPKNGLIRLKAVKEDGFARISIDDTGEGIEPDFLPHLFDKFSQQDSSSTRKHGGLGLGLAIVKQIVDLHGGSVTAYSRGLGMGSCFVVKIPILIQSFEAAAKVQADAERVHEARNLPSDFLKGLKVLVVDDLPDSQFLMEHFVASKGGETQSANSVADGMKVLENWIPDVIVSDIAMPDEDGYVFAGRVRELGDDRALIPMIAVTAYARAEDRERCRQAGFTEHVAKPIDPVGFVLTVGKLAGREIH